MTGTRQRLAAARRGGDRRVPVTARPENTADVPAGNDTDGAQAPSDGPVSGTAPSADVLTAPSAGGPAAPAADGSAVLAAQDLAAGCPGTGDGQEAVVILERVRTAVDPALRSALESLPGAMRRVSLYHFGWEHEDGTPAAGNSGKAIRPALVLTAAAALGGPRARTAAVRAAAAVELVHNFTLLHDDVMDRDTTRRHRPTAWTVFGDAGAILAGDAMQALALRLLAEDPHPASAAAASRLAACVIELCEGQQVDTAMERRPPTEVGLDEVLVMAEAKTGALLGCACALGALYAGASPDDVEALDAFGREAGLAFQLIDDVIGIWGDPGHTGKPARADLAARKKSLPVVAALTSGTPAAAELAALYEVPYDQEDLERTALAVERAGGRDWAQAQAADRMSRAMSELARAIPDPETAGGLLSLAEFVTRRTS
ncbi:family 2 encapsulin nanocompartment cargo protein polyprenyl transferase [Streptomyces sp. NPDC093094]|uniref:family 2 encapsulin nanocompartment cargo protein polyprenyl transferase n=1 Tax=Streptomyces sp. NPDC093094 TaxID=3366026 RepID=UPI0037FEA885